MLTPDGTAETVSRDQILRPERGQRNIQFPCSADHEQDWQPYPCDPYSCYMCDHTSTDCGGAYSNMWGGNVPGDQNGYKTVTYGYVVTVTKCLRYGQGHYYVCTLFFASSNNAMAAALASNNPCSLLISNFAAASASSAAWALL